MPGMVAITFSFRILQVEGGLLYEKMSRASTTRAGATRAAVVAVAPLLFDSKVYDVPSGRQVNGTRAAVVAVAPLPFRSKACDVSSGRQGSLRSRRDESGGVCQSDSLQKVDKLSVAEPTFENERLA
jgi:hypothetical protein